MTDRKWLGLSSGYGMLALTSVASLVGFAVAASAAPGKCMLRVDGHTYLNGACDIDLMKGGDFKIAPLREVNPYYFAYVNLDSSSPGTAKGSWNGKEAESHAQDDLGTLTRKGACWSNAHAEICASAK